MKSIANALGLGDAALEADADDQLRRRLEREIERNQRLAAYWHAFKASPTSLSPAEPMDDLGPCDTCHSTRWVKVRPPGGQPWESEVIACPKCPKSVRVTLAQQYAKQLDWSPEMAAKLFANFQSVPGAAEARQAAEAWAKDPRGFLVLHGQPGSGKTHLAAAACNWLILNRRPVSFWYAPDLLADFKARISTNETALLLDRVKDTEHLILDDLGAVQATDFAIRGFLEPLINHRYARKLPTLLTCIGSPEAVKTALSESIGRRLQDASVSTVVPITAPQFGVAA